jgi:hypothetical protein
MLDVYLDGLLRVSQLAFKLRNLPMHPFDIVCSLFILLGTL